ncbi:hypothetical protein HCD_00615 [Helicobacter cetorum MIT 99-5656]|uniref:Uncharacterized protein n=1 Tax=Helicobacter cetorum (strain ATCC BAA-540 / CCUG 52418 / MIT 99-5656) TaxID=1163745 RepID=I0EQD6_HELCM|nr:hypothetical protein HCD_00615 [Helicobacter cetorum MIT 99-5656]
MCVCVLLALCACGSDSSKTKDYWVKHEQETQEKLKECENTYAQALLGSKQPSNDYIAMCQKIDEANREIKAIKAKQERIKQLAPTAECLINVSNNFKKEGLKALEKDYACLNTAKSFLSNNWNNPRATDEQISSFKKDDNKRTEILGVCFNKMAESLKKEGDFSALKTEETMECKSAYQSQYLIKQALQEKIAKEKAQAKALQKKKENEKLMASCFITLVKHIAKSKNISNALAKEDKRSACENGASTYNRTHEISKFYRYNVSMAGTYMNKQYAPGFDGINKQGLEKAISCFKKIGESIKNTGNYPTMGEKEASMCAGAITALKGPGQYFGGMW